MVRPKINPLDVSVCVQVAIPKLEMSPPLTKRETAWLETSLAFRVMGRSLSEPVRVVKWSVLPIDGYTLATAIRTTKRHDLPPDGTRVATSLRAREVSDDLPAQLG